jgi:hypothetical protein
MAGVFVSGPGVTPLVAAYNIDVTSVLTDADVATSTVEFETDGSEVLVVYEGGDNTYPDPARPDREGHKGVLNAFELTFVAPPPLPTACGLYKDRVVDGKDLGVLTDNWLWVGMPGGQANVADLNGDGKVSFVDYAVLADQWLQSCQ